MMNSKVWRKKQRRRMQRKRMQRKRMQRKRMQSTDNCIGSDLVEPFASSIIHQQCSIMSG